MKTNAIFKTLLILCLVFSCTAESILDEELLEVNDVTTELNSESPESNERRNLALSHCGTIIPILITDGPNALSGPTVYATAGVDLRSYPREITVTVFSNENRELLDQINLVIPPNQSLSNFLPILPCYGVEPLVTSTGGVSPIRLSITSVRNMSNWSFETCYDLADMNFSIPKCPKEINPTYLLYLLKEKKNAGNLTNGYNF
jgi:hypothetical protein